MDEKIPCHQFQDDTEEDAVAAQGVDENVADTGVLAARAGIIPDEKGGSDGFQFPKAEEGDPVMGQDDADGGSNVGHGAESFQGAFVVAAVNPADDA